MARRWVVNCYFTTVPIMTTSGGSIAARRDLFQNLAFAWPKLKVAAISINPNHLVHKTNGLLLPFHYYANSQIYQKFIYAKSIYPSVRRLLHVLKTGHPVDFIAFWTEFFFLFFSL